MPTDTFPITSDADDGDCNRNYTDWATVIGGGGNFVVGDTADATVAKSLFAGDYYVNVTFLRFDTSSIPAGATIDSATLKLYATDKGDPDGVSYAADYYDFGGEPSVAADWEASSAGGCISGFTAASISTGVVNSIALTGLSGIMRSGETNGQGNTGITGIRITQANLTQPTGDNFITFAAREHATAQEPRLDVTYTVPATGASVSWIKA